MLAGSVDGRYHVADRDASPTVETMIAVQLHVRPKPSLSKGTFFVPIVNWGVARPQIRAWLRYTSWRYATMVRIPADFPVRICFSYGASNFIKGIVWPMEPKPLGEWEPAYLQAVAEWWDAQPRGPAASGETGGLMVDEPRLFLGARLPAKHVRWTKDLRLLYHRKPARTKNVR